MAKSSKAQLKAVPSLTEEPAKEEAKANPIAEKGTAMAEGRRKTEEAEAYLMERINSAQRLEAFLNRLNFDTLVKLEDGIKLIKDRKRLEAEEERKAQIEREKVEQKILELAAAAGIELEITGAKKRKRKAGTDPEKYAVHFKDTGETFYWSGCGMPPKPFKYAIEEKKFKKETLLNPKNGKPFGIAKAPK